MENTKIFDLIKEGYIYGYPIVGMYELLYNQVINPETRKADFNEFVHTAALATPETSFIPAPNNDTSYSRAWLDLRKEPVVIETPDTNDRFYSIQLLDLFSETITNIGRRLNGTKAQKFAVVGPNWKGSLPEGVTAIESQTTFVLAFLRVLIKGGSDIENVKQIQNGFVLRTLSEFLGNTTSGEESEEFPPYNTSSYEDFFITLNGVLSLTPMLLQDKEILSRLKEIGIGPNLEFGTGLDIPNALSYEACDSALGQVEEGGMQFGEEANYWRIARQGIGNYGTDYFQRAVVWHKGALANQPQESLYPSTFQDSNGAFLDGNNKYKLHFAATELPPVSQFWSLTMYRFSNAMLVENEIDRYSLGDRTKGLLYDEDGGLSIYIQSEPPQSEKEKANWLPAPKEKFYMSLRLYGPSDDAISGKWQPPAVSKVG